MWTYFNRKTTVLPATITVMSISLAALACNAIAPSRPELKWQTDRHTLVVTAGYWSGLSSGGGPMVNIISRQNYVPEAQLWGDGRLVWTTTGANGERQVMIAYLDQAEMLAVLSIIADSGFFGLKDSYTCANFSDMESQCIKVTLSAAEKSVCEYYRGAPESFHQLYQTLSEGVGRRGALYAVSRGYLIAHPLTMGGQGAAPPPAAPWHAKSVGLSLANARSGLWVAGEPLALAWRIVNANPFSNVVRDGKQYYQLAVMIPGITRMQPGE